MVLSAGIRVHAKPESAFTFRQNDRSRQARIRTLAKAVFKFYRINYNGLEEEYFVTTLENVKVCHVVPVMFDTKDPDFEKHGHIEHV